MKNIDATRNVYIFLHGRMDLKEKAEAALASAGFDVKSMIMARPDAAGEPGEYMAMLWRPPNPDTIRIQQITMVEPVEPEGMIGLWKGVSSDIVDTIPLVS